MYRDIPRITPHAGSRFVSERLNPSGFPANVGLDEVMERFVCQLRRLNHYLVLPNGVSYGNLRKARHI